MSRWSPITTSTTSRCCAGRRARSSAQNATGGAVFVNTNDPIIGGGFHGYLNANYGNYQRCRARRARSTCRSATTSRRASHCSASGATVSGNITGPGGAPYTGNNGDLRMFAGRLSLLWKPSDRCRSCRRPMSATWTWAPIRRAPPPFI
ncbi:MAG: hypothetical protein WDN24_17860 [Sphingomonas sp.]